MTYPSTAIYPSNAIRRGAGPGRSASPDNCVRVLACVLSGTRLTGAIAAELDLPKSMVNAAIHALRDAEAVDFTVGKKGTIHPTVTVVANGVPDGS